MTTQDQDAREQQAQAYIDGADAYVRSPLSIDHSRRDFYIDGFVTARKQDAARITEGRANRDKLYERIGELMQMQQDKDRRIAALEAQLAERTASVADESAQTLCEKADAWMREPSNGDGYSRQLVNALTAHLQHAESQRAGNRNAYEGAREDLLEWKRRAQVAEAQLAERGEPCELDEAAEREAHREWAIGYALSVKLTSRHCYQDRVTEASWHAWMISARRHRSSPAHPVSEKVAVPEKYDDTLLPFLALMRKELHANSAKGDRPGWMTMSRKQALSEIYYHVGKLQAATVSSDYARIAENAADVGNAAMMLADLCGLLAPTQPEKGA